MIIDNFEIFFFVRLNRAVLENSELTTWQVAKEFFVCEGEQFMKRYGGDRLRFITAKTNAVKKRLERLSQEGLIEIFKDSGKNRFVLNNDRVLFQRHSFPKRRRDAILILDKNNKWNVFEI